MNRSFQRKVVYLAAIAVLLVPLSLISRPATIAGDGDTGSDGGKLAQLRKDYRLGQAQLGRVDPTSSAVRYVSLGMHGIAACVLWNKVDEYQKQEDWISLSAVLNQLTFLQPYYVKVWTYQSWNVSYNISSQWDDHRDKYFWVIRGLKMLHQGMEFNELEPELPYEIGWMIGHKIGQSDERREFRKLFAEDDDFHRLQWTSWVEERDNWLFGKKYVEFAQNLVDTKGAVLRSKGAEIFNMEPAILQSLYCQTLERDGIFGQKARDAWKQAIVEWKRFGDREFPTEQGFPIRFNELKDLEDRLAAATQELERLAPGVREQIKAEKRAKLAAESRQALDLLKESRTSIQERLAREAEGAVQATDAEVAQRVDSAHRDQARQLAATAAGLRIRIFEIQKTRKTFNYDYWVDRAAMETTDEALQARELFHRALVEADEKPWAARKTFEEGFALWRKIVDKYPVMLDDQTSYEIYEMSKVYRRVLSQLDEPFEMKSFILRDLLEKYEILN